MRGRRLAAVVAVITYAVIAAGPAGDGLAEPGPLVWATRYDGVGRDDAATDVAVGSRGDVAFVTGRSEVVAGASDYATVAYDSSGGELWESRYHGRAGGENIPAAIAANLEMVFVAGQSLGLDRNPDYATVAYDAKSGTQRWVRRLGPERGEAVAMAIAVSPDTTAVFVTGWSFEYGFNRDFVTVAYDTTTGDELWRAVYAGPAEDDVPQAIAVSPDGGRVFVTGGSVNVNTNLNFATVAYDAVTGAERWVRRYAPGGLYSGATDVAVGPEGNRVYVTGFSPAPGNSNDYATLAYRAGDGARLWVSRFDFAPEGYDKPHAIAVSPRGGQVFITGESGHLGEPTDYLTIAMNAATGARQWVTRFGGPAGGSDVARDVGVDGAGTVYVTGESQGANGLNFLTIAYDPATGVADWVSPQGTLGGADSAMALAVGPSAVHVTGTSQGSNDFDFLTLAYGTS